MPLVQVKCSNCNGTLSVEEGLEKAICPFCNTQYIVEKAINNYNVSNTVNVGKGAVVNIIGGDHSDFLINAGLLYGYKGAAVDVVIPNDAKKIADRTFANKGITSVRIPSSVEVIGREAFADCNELKTVYLEEGVKKIEEGAFSNCKVISEVILPESVRTIGMGAFENCISLKKVKLPGELGDIEACAFKNCKSLQKIELPVALKMINSETFKKCDSLEEVFFPRQLVIIGDDAFSECSALKNIDIPNSVKEIQRGAFFSCKSLNSVSLPDSIKLIDSHVFCCCSSLKNINIPSGVKYLKYGTFSDCTSLENVTFSEGIKIIGAETFAGDTFARQVYSSYDSVFGHSAIKNIRIPASVEAIGAGAFQNCELLETVTYERQHSVQIYDKAFLGCDKLDSKTPGNAKKSEGCYIATAVYGSYDCPQVWTLRRYRDYSLYNSFLGRFFIRVYYFFSPMLVNYFGKNRLFRLVWRSILDKSVEKLNKKGYVGTPYNDNTRIIGGSKSEKYH